MQGARHAKLLVLLGVSAVLGVLMVLGGATALASARTAGTPVPSGFVGMNADGPLFDAHVDLPGQLNKMAASGVERIRVDFDWAAAQPYARCSKVPGGCKGPWVVGPGGVPTDFTLTDHMVTLAAQRHLSLLPVVIFSPRWDSSHGSDIQPAHARPYGLYLKALVQRYGPHGTFWSAHRSVPRDPITEWQIWNEPDLTSYWRTQPFAPSYVALLRAAHSAIKRADPHATVVLGALTNYGWDDLDSVYKVRGSRHLFDTVAADVYTAHPSGVITILRYYRRAMARHGDGSKPIIATEVGWPSDRSVAPAGNSFSTTEKGQATKLARLLPLLGHARQALRLAGFFYYTWMSTDKGGSRAWWTYSGLLRFNPSSHHISPKPAYWAFRRTVRRLEG